MGHREGYRWHRGGTWRPSPAQARVLDGVAAGLSNGEIARQLGLTPETVKWHLSTLLGETGCADRQELAAWWRTRREGHAAALPILELLTRLPRIGLAITATGVVSLGVVLGVRHAGGENASPATSMATTPPLVAQPPLTPEAATTIPSRARLIGTLHQVAGGVLVVDIGGSSPARAVVGAHTKIVLVSTERGSAGVQPGDIVRWGRGYYGMPDGTSLVWDPLAYETTAPVVLLHESLLGIDRSIAAAERCRWEGVVRAREGDHLRLATFECGEQIVTIDPERPITRQQPLSPGELPLGVTVNVYGETLVDGSIAAQTVVATEHR